MKQIKIIMEITKALNKIKKDSVISQKTMNNIIALADSFIEDNSKTGEEHV